MSSPGAQLIDFVVDCGFTVERIARECKVPVWYIESVQKDENAVTRGIVTKLFNAGFTDPIVSIQGFLEEQARFFQRPVEKLEEDSPYVVSVTADNPLLPAYYQLEDSLQAILKEYVSLFFHLRDNREEDLDAVLRTMDQVIGEFAPYLDLEAIYGVPTEEV